MTNNLDHVLTSVDKLLLLRATIHANLHMPCTTDYYKREIYVLYAFGPTHATKVETEMILATFNNIYITGFK